MSHCAKHSSAMGQTRSSAVPLSQPALEGILVARYKRFLADVRLADGRILTVHCPNSGAMKTCFVPGSTVRISDSQDPKRKLRFTWELSRVGNTWVGINTITPNRAVARWIEGGFIPELSGYPVLRREVRCGSAARSRIDLLLQDPRGSRPDCYVEIKNTTLRAGEYAAFPDAVTARGRKHLLDLAAEAEIGRRSVLFFFVGRSDCIRVRPADEIDPQYGRTLREVVRRGVELLAYRAEFTAQEVRIDVRLPIDLP
jgi:sugar fermentation stimulation protein A